MVGPTEEGSIVAHVQAELSNFDAGMDKADARVKEVSATKAEVKVTAAVDDAIRKIDTVDRAVNKLGDDNVKASAKTVAAQAAVEQSLKRQTLATDALKIAYQRLDDIQMRGNATSAQVMAGHLAAARAENAEERATLQLAAANEILKRSRAADGVTPPPSSAPPASAAAGGGAGAGMAGVVVAVVAGLLPIIAALAGYLSAVTGAFAGMGAAGILAVLGIKNAMAAGTTAGNVFSSGLHVLKGDLDQLSATAATAMLVSFQQAINTIDAQMPSLNSEIRLFSGMLGTTGNIVLTAIVSGFKTLLPLFAQAGVYVEQLAVGFQRWTTGGGLAQWSRDASVALPQVADAFGSLMHGVIAVVGALQPLGTVMLGIIGILGDVLSVLAMLGPAFPVLAAGTLAAVGAFMLFTKVPAVVGLVSKAVTLLGISTEAALGPIGWVAAAIAAIAAIAATATAATNDAAAAVDSYAAAIQQDNGVIGKNTAAQAASNLQLDGAITKAKLLGISVKVLTDATLGNAGAHDKLVTAVKKAEDAYYKAALASQANTKLYGATEDAYARMQVAREALASSKTEAQAIKAQIKAYNDIQAALGGATISTKAQLDAQTALAASYGDSVPVYLAAKGAQKQAADQLAATTAAMVQENDASSLLTNALTLLNGGSLSVAQAQTGLAASNNSLLDSFKQNGRVVDGSTKAAVANQQAIQQQVTAAQLAAEAIGKQTGSSVAAIQSYKDSKDAIEAQLKAQGDLTPAVQTYLDKLYDIANLKVPPTKLDVDTAAAMAKAQALLDLMNRVTASATSGPLASKLSHIDKAAGKANGGTIGLAGGGTSGTVSGAGSSTSDSVVTRLSIGEEVIRTASANQGRPFLKMFNQNPAQAISQVMAAGAAAAKQITNTYPTTIIVQADPAAAFVDFQRRNNMRAA